MTPTPDPVVSPADTIRQALNDYLPDGFRDEDGVWHDGPVLQDALAALDALLAVGERDRAERDAAVREAGVWQRDRNVQVAALTAERERDRRQIAQLTEALQRLEPVQQRVLGMIERNGFVFRTPLDQPDNERTEAERWEKLAFTLYSELCETDTIVRAVLAGEEDARP